MSGPALSNYLTDLADRIGERAARFKRASREAVEAALEAGAMLVEARAGCRHGQWLPMLKRAGIARATAHDWMKLAGSGLTVDEVLDRGGVRLALMSLADPARVRTVASQVDEAELPEMSDIGHLAGADDAERRPVVQESGLGKGEPEARKLTRLPRTEAPRRKRNRLIPRAVPNPVSRRPRPAV